MLVEYAGAYGGFPDPKTPWPLFVLGVREANRFAARRLLNQMHGVAWGIGRALSQDGGALEGIERKVQKHAYPWKTHGGGGPAFVQTNGGIWVPPEKESD